jgi:hypothetical protein
VHAELVLVVHETVGVTDPVLAFDNVLEGVQKVKPVLVALENGLSLIAPGSDVVDRTGIFNTKRAGYSRRISKQNEKV